MAPLSVHGERAGPPPRPRPCPPAGQALGHRPAAGSPAGGAGDGCRWGGFTKRLDARETRGGPEFYRLMQTTGGSSRAGLWPRHVLPSVSCKDDHPENVRPEKAVAVLVT